MTNAVHVKPTWETVVRADAGPLTLRLAVPGGWLYAVYGPVERIGGNVAATVAPTIALQFVPLSGVDATNRDRDEHDAATGGPGGRA